MFLRTDRVVKTGESWAAAGLLVHQFWTQGVPALIATGVGTWLASNMNFLQDEGWATWILVGAGFAFFILGAASAVARFRYTWKAGQAVDRAVRWNSAIFSPGAIIDGGTHTISEIFGNDAVRSNILFRNCQITGPGVISFFNSPTEKCESSGVPIPVNINIDKDFAEVGNHVHQFHKCRFENVVFYNIILISHPNVNAWLPTHLFAKLNDQERENLLQGPEDKPEEKKQ